MGQFKRGSEKGLVGASPSKFPLPLWVFVMDVTTPTIPIPFTGESHSFCELDAFRDSQLEVPVDMDDGKVLGILIVYSAAMLL